jgi:uncharacterized membrane protein
MSTSKTQQSLTTIEASTLIAALITERNTLQKYAEMYASDIEDRNFRLYTDKTNKLSNIIQQLYHAEGTLSIVQ